MSTYVTEEGLEAKLGRELYAQLTDRETGETVDRVVGQAIVDEAEQIVHGYLGTRYVVPVTDATAISAITPHVLSIAAFLAWRDNPLARSAAKKSAARMAYDESIKWFKSIADRTVNLASAAELPTSPGGPLPKTFGHATKYTEDAMDGL